MSARATGYSKTGRDYAKLDVLAPEHPKVAGLSDRTFRVWVEAILYCQRNLTDGFVPHGVVDARRGWRAASVVLVAVHLWDAADDGYWIHDYLEWNDSRAEVEARIERARTGGRARAKQAAQQPVEPDAQRPAEPPAQQDAQRKSQRQLSTALDPALGSTDSLSPTSHGIARANGDPAGEKEATQRLHPKTASLLRPLSGGAA